MLRLRRGRVARSLHDERVELTSGGAQAHHPPRERDLVGHDLVERLVGLRAHDDATVDEEGGRAPRAGVGGRLGVCVDPRSLPPFLHRGGDGAHIRSDRRGVAPEILARERPLVLEEEVVIAPEHGVSALAIHLHRRFCRVHGVVVKGERVIAKDDAHFVRMLTENASDRRLDARAEGALVVGEHHDRCERLGGAAHGRVLDADPGPLVGRFLQSGVDRRRDRSALASLLSELGFDLAADLGPQRGFIRRRMVRAAARGGEGEDQQGRSASHLGRIRSFCEVVPSAPAMQSLPPCARSRRCRAEWLALRDRHPAAPRHNQ